MIETIEGVRVEYGAGAYSSANERRPIIRRMIAGHRVKSVRVDGHTTFRMINDVDIVYPALDGARTIGEVLEDNAKAIKAHVGRQGVPYVIDANDAHVAFANGCGWMIRQLSRTAEGQLRIYSWNAGNDSVLPSIVTLHDGDPYDGNKVILEGGRISSIVRRDGQSWSRGSLLVGRKVSIPATLVAALPGRPLDEVVADTMLAGRDLIVRKAWNVGGSLGMTFGSKMISVEQALSEWQQDRMTA